MIVFVDSDDRGQELAGDIANWINAMRLTDIPVTLMIAPDEFLAVGSSEDDPAATCGAYAWEKGRPRRKLPDADPVRLAVISPVALRNLREHIGDPTDDASVRREWVDIIAHEYRHHLQWCEQRHPSERDAVTWADAIASAYMAHASAAAIV